MTRRLAAGALAVLLAAGCGPRAPSPTMMREHPEFAARTGAAPHLAILPPRVTVWELRFNDDTVRLRDLERQFETELIQLIEAKLATDQLVVRPAGLDQPELAAHRDLRFQLSELYQSYDQMSWRVYRTGAQPPDAARQCHATMGPAVNPFANRANADSLLFVSLDAATKSAGLRGKDAFFAVLAALGGMVYQPRAAGAVLEVALVDGTTGELLWSNHVGATFGHRLDADAVMDITADTSFLVNLAFAQFPPPEAGEPRRRP